MPGLVSQAQQTAFTTPANGDSGDASVVLANDNAVRAKHNTHDADATIHVQSSLLASRPTAGTAQRIWVTTDGRRAYLDNGTSWEELAYLPTVGGTMDGPITSDAFAEEVSSIKAGETVALANDATHAFLLSRGLVLVGDAVTGALALVALAGGAGTIVWQSGSLFSGTADTASKINVYGSAGTVIVQNKSGSSATLACVSLMLF